MKKTMGVEVVKAGRYTIRAGIVSGKPKAFIFLRDKKIAGVEFSCPDLQATIVAAENWTAEEASRLHQGRRKAENGNYEIPTEHEYSLFLKLHKLAKHEREMLRFHASRVNATMTEIADAVGWNDYSAANLHYGSLGVKIAKELGFSLDRREDGSEIGISAIGSSGALGENGHYVLSIYPELIAALQKAGITEASK